MSAFSCYFDASGTQHDQLVLTVAGLMATADRWIEFEKEWLNRLRSANLKYFHRKETSEKKHPGLIEDLAKVTRDYAQRKFAFTVKVKALHETVEDRTIGEWNLDAYSYAGRACAGFVRLWAQYNHLRSLPEIIFATGDAGRDQLEKRLKRDGFDPRFQPALDQIDRKTGLVIPAAVPLQAGDLYAGELFTWARKMEAAGNKLINPEDLTPTWFTLDKIPGEPQIMSLHGLKAIKERLKKFTEDSDDIAIASWMPDPMSHI